MDEIFEWIVSHIPWVLVMLISLTLGTAMYAHSSLTRFEYESDQIISRSGGLTKPAYEMINETSKAKYNNMFHVSLTDKKDYQDKPSDYGDDITYKITATIPLFGWLSGLGDIKTGGYRTVQNDVRVDSSQ